jgi:hypothetical protein
MKTWRFSPHTTWRVALTISLRGKRDPVMVVTNEMLMLLRRCGLKYKGGEWVKKPSYYVSEKERRRKRRS